MKLLICTQTVDMTDPALGFFHAWIVEFAKHCTQVTVLCLNEGEHHLPRNVTVHSLGKEKGSVSRTRYAFRFLRFIYAKRYDYDAIFVHMNPEYVVLGGFLWRMWRKRIALWYVHRSVTLKLRIAVRFADVILTASQSSFRLSTPKLRVAGHGIDTELFKPMIRESSIETRIITIGRISPSKRLIEMLQVLDILYARDEKFRFTIMGAPAIPGDARYVRALREEIAKRPYSGKVEVVGPKAHSALPGFLNMQDVFLNFSTTGSIDKAVLEALSMGVPVVTTNAAFEELLEPFDLYIAHPNVEVLADTIDHAMNRPDRAAVVATLRNKVVAEHSLVRLVPRLLRALESQ
jgi:glycosyltransferase involved in cell wall biosynthesis